MPDTADVVDLDEYRFKNTKLHEHNMPDYRQHSTGLRDTGEGLTTKDQNLLRPEVKLSIDRDANGEIGDRRRMTIEELYRGTSVGPIPFAEASELLSNVFEWLTDALEAAAAGDVLAVDNQLIYLRDSLPDLFYVSGSFGDGFGESIRAVHHALANNVSDVPSAEQLEEIRFLIRRLRQQPFADMDQAVKWTMDLENAGLNVDHPVVGLIADAVIDEASAEE